MSTKIAEKKRISSQKALNHGMYYQTRGGAGRVYLQGEDQAAAGVSLACGAWPGAGSFQL
jgi:hypothetical protein